MTADQNQTETWTYHLRNQIHRTHPRSTQKLQLAIQMLLVVQPLAQALLLSTTHRIASPPRSVYRDPASPTSIATSHMSSTVLPIPYLPLSSLGTPQHPATSSNSPPCATSCRTSNTRACYYISIQIYNFLCSKIDTHLQLL